jgi:DNA-binding Lrp family transcriptional regulator
MKPDFYIIPREIQETRGLRPADWIVYAVIYWYEHLRDGRCTASNSSIAEVAGFEDRTVRAGLDRLEKSKAIRRIYFDKERKKRSHIETLVRFSRVEAKDTPPIIDEGQELELPEDPTPGEIAKEFFDPQNSFRRNSIVEEICQATGAPREAVETEVKKFVFYWTEPNKSGTKQKWQLQQTFDVKRRIYTWLSRANVRSTAGSRSGAGVTI